MSHTRNEEGRIVVRLPFIEEPTLSDTKAIAEKCLLRIERRFTRQPDLQRAYAAFMAEYWKLHYMQVVPAEQVDSKISVYLPHHPVLKKGDSSKIRVVFNASQLTSEGTSLNSFMHVGPKQQEDVSTFMLRWSFLHFVFSCDVVKMFRQFLVHEADTDWQRIVWRNSSYEPIQSFRLTTVTYGTACAPFLANACMLQLTDDEEKRYPIVSKVLRKNRYADDFLAGEDILGEAVTVREELVKILASAGMSVGKWASNCPDLLNNLDVPLEQTDEAMIPAQETVATLGLRWISSEDVFCFRVSHINLSEKITKRSMLSEIARLYDPIGWLSPVVIQAKIHLQNLWMQGIGWDDPVPQKLRLAWSDFKEQLGQLETIKIPRWIGTDKNSVWELHGF